MFDASMHESLQARIDRFGYAVPFIGTVLEGKTLLVLAGAEARLGHLKLEWVIACAFAGSLLGNLKRFELQFFAAIAIVGLGLWGYHAARGRRRWCA
jgi:hypothetical protein